jgi:hypothetical protein
MADSPNGPYLPNTENTLTLTQAFDLSSYFWGRMYFWRAMAIHTSDTLFVEYKKENGDWITIRKMNGTFPNTWKKDSIDIPGSSGETFIRFRLKSDGTNESNGILLDDIEIVGNTYIETSVPGNQTTTVPEKYDLHQNYPNPFNPTTAITYQLMANSNITLKIYDVLGREVTTLADGIKEAGYYIATFDASGLSSGIYFARLTATPANGEKPFVQVRKLMLMK